MSTRCCEPGVAVMEAVSEGFYIADNGDCYETLYVVSDDAEVTAVSPITDCSDCTSSSCEPSFTNWKFVNCDSSSDFIVLAINDNWNVQTGQGVSIDSKCYEVLSLGGDNPQGVFDTLIDDICNVC